MFTGIVEDLGSIDSITAAAESAAITVRTALPLAKIAIGESIAVNGCCLTVTRKGRRTFTMDVSAESMRRTTFGKLQAGDRVNLERCLTLHKLLGGHMVSGHVDGTGRVVAVTPEGDSSLYTFEVGAEQGRYLIEKGSVTIDGVSLTVFDIYRINGGRNGSGEYQFKVALIPHTLAVTTLGLKGPGDAVNVETDLLVKYVERVAAPYLDGKSAPRSRSRKPPRGLSA